MSLTEAKDTLRSRQYARILDVICEGEIEGPAESGLKWIYLDGTPAENSDGSANHDNVRVVLRTGTGDQPYVKGFPSVEVEHVVGVELTYGDSLVRTITNAAFNQVRVTVSVPALYDTDVNTGDTGGTAVAVAISVQPDGGSYTQVLYDRIAGKATSKYQRSYLIDLPEGGAPWNIQVDRMSADSTRQTWQRDTWWDSYTEIINAKLRYPHTAYAAAIFDSEQFDAIPDRGFDLKLRKIEVPSNYDPIARTYDGTWDGTFQTLWSDNPAWVFRDIVLNPRFGLGQYIEAGQVDKWALYQIAQYCDELVPDGFGGMEPRFRCGLLYLQERAEAYTVMRDIASIFRAMLYWADGQICPVQDAPAPPVALFTCANVVDGLFTYQGASLKQRHSVALVTWNDPADLYRQRIEYVEDQALIAEIGLVPTEKLAIGCTSRGQAHRVGKWLLFSEKMETETVSFRVGLDGSAVRPGEIVQVQDAARAGTRRGGRIAAATDTVITVDKMFPPAVGVSYTFMAMMADGSLAEAAVASVDGDTITLADALPAAPLVNAIWAVESDDLALQTFRVLAMADQNDGTFELTALKHNPEKFDFIESNILLDPDPISLTNAAPDEPSNLTVDESLYAVNGQVKLMVTVSWDEAARAQTYNLTYRRNDDNLVTIVGITAPLYDIRDALPGSYEVSVAAVAFNGKRASSGTVTKQILGKTALPSPVRNFSLANIGGGQAQLSWAQSPDLDVQIGGYVRLRWTPDKAATGDDWVNAIDAVPALPGASTGASVPFLSGSYLAKFVDSSGNPSATAAVAVASAAALQTMNVVETFNEAPTFSGTKTNVVYDSGAGGLLLDDTAALTDDPDVVDQWNFLNGQAILSSGVYEFESPDLGAAYPCRITALPSVVGVADGLTIDNRPGTIDTWSSIDGEAADDVNALLFISTTEDDPGGSPSWSPYQLFCIGTYTMRQAKFKLALTSCREDHNIIVTDLPVTIDMPDRQEDGKNLSSGAGSFDVDFTIPFKAVPSISITPRNMASGDYFELSGINADGFTVIFKNSAGTAISRSFDFQAKGHGYRI